MDDVLQVIRDFPIDKSEEIIKLVIPLTSMPSDSFLERPSDDERAEFSGLLTGSHCHGRPDCTSPVSTSSGSGYSGRGFVVISGTGSGKSLSIAIPHLLRPGTISVMFSPPKSLEATQASNPFSLVDLLVGRSPGLRWQVADFTKFGIKTLSINDYIPNDPNFWTVSKVGICYLINI